MCCNNLSTPVRGHFPPVSFTGAQHADCGCGCIGKEQSVSYLENYQEHLKAELKSVERQIKLRQQSAV